jgi:hypothetical protein
MHSIYHKYKLNHGFWIIQDLHVRLVNYYDLFSIILIKVANLKLIFHFCITFFFQNFPLELCPYESSHKIYVEWNCKWSNGKWWSHICLFLHDDTPPNSLIDSNASPKVKITEEERVGAQP